MKALIVQATQEFEKLKPEWDRLLAESKDRNIFLSFDWQYTWWKRFGKNYQLFIILSLGNDNRINGIMPLMKQSVYGFRQLRFISGPLADYEGFILCAEARQREEALDSAFGYLAKSDEWDMLKLTRIKEGDLAGGFFRKAKYGLQTLAGQHKEGAPYLELSGEWEDFCLGLRKKFLADTKRQASRLNALGPDRFIFKKATCAAEIGPYIDKLAEFHRLRRGSKATKSIFDEPLALDFLKEVAAIFFAKGWLDLSLLSNSSVVAALSLGFKYKNTEHYYIPAFNASLKQYSAGRLLLYELLHSSFDDSASEFDFMLGEEGYKNEWNTKIRKLYFLNAYPRTLKGGVARFIFSFLNLGLKRMLNRNW